MRKIKVLAALGLVTMMAVMAPAAVLGDTLPEGYDAETWQKLQDNVLEYDEIPNLVREYSPGFQMLQTGIASGTAPYTKMVSDLREQADTSRYLYQEAKDTGDTVNAKIHQKAYQALKKQADKLEKSLISQSRSQVNETQKQLISATQGLMINYHQTLAVRDMTQVVAELAQAGYDLTKTQQAIGMATETDVKTAEKSMLEAQAGLEKVEDGITVLRQNLCMMTGWSYDAQPEIGPVPEPDLSRIDSMDPQADFTKAKGNNYELTQLRTSTQKGTVRTRTTEEAEALLKTNLENLYQEVIQNKAAYEAAATAYQGAQLTMNGADAKFQMGMLGRPEYLKEKLDYQQQRASYVQASLGLTQSMETYHWAVEGLADIK